MRRSWLLPVALLVAGLLAAGHWRAHYASRERAAIPAATGGAAAVLADPGYPVRLWLAHPHQNLGWLARHLGDLDGWLAAAGRLAGLSLPPLRRFGPFVVPPARELALGLDPESGRSIVVLRLHPAVAVTARLAGALARNPWLAGGEIAVRGESFQVGWKGREWLLRTRGAELPAGGTAPAAGPPAIARLTLTSPLGNGGLAAGSYRLERRGENLWFRPEEADGASVPALPRLGRERLALFAGERGPEGTRAFVLWREEGDVPDVATLGAGDVAPRSLPGEALLRLGGRPAREEAAGGWRARGYSGTAVADALALGADAEAPFATLGAAGGRLIWADPAALARLAGELANLFESLPIAGRQEAKRWRDLATVLAPLSGFGELAALLPAEPVAGELPAGCLRTPAAD